MESLAKYILHWLAVCVIFVLTGCASNTAYRTQYSLCEYKHKGDCAKSVKQHYSVEKDNAYYLSFMEYDDQGQMYDVNQMDSILTLYNEVASNNEVLIVVFVHGWHHSAKPEDDNISSFRTMLRLLARSEAANSDQQNREARKILGVYVGWRGDSITLPGLKYLTFWDRKNTAQEVGLQGVSQMLLRLEEIRNVKRAIEDEVPPPKTSRMVVIGHSFGGAVVFTSLQNILTDRFIDSREDKNYSGDAKGFGDLVVLMNPAFEALRYSTLYDLSQYKCRLYFPGQVPRLAILTSESDLATKYAFPAGRFFSTILELHSDLKRNYCDESGAVTMTVSEGEADRTAVGHFSDYWTHKLLATGEHVDKSQIPDSGPETNALQIQQNWQSLPFGGVLSFDGSELHHLGRSKTLNPYLNVMVDDELINNHNDIWQPRMVTFLRDFLLISTTPHDDKQGNAQ